MNRNLSRDELYRHARTIGNISVPRKRRTVMWPDDWEVRCVRPGTWRVEGYEVVRVRKRWHVTVGTAYDRRDVGSALRLEDVVTLIDHDLHDVSK